MSIFENGRKDTTKFVTFIKFIKFVKFIRFVKRKDGTEIVL